MIPKTSYRALLAHCAIFGLSAVTMGAIMTGQAAVASASPYAPVAGNALAGKTVFLDPGHQGAATPQELRRQVSDGRGSTKNCQSMGATSIYHIPEHRINWDVAQYVKSDLEAQGARVLLSRNNDSSWAGCITDRAEEANRSGADAAISIHADSTTFAVDPRRHGFHLIVPTLPIADATINQVQSTKGLQLSKDVRDAMLTAGFPISNYISTDNGLSSRFDVAGPALTRIPLALVEMGNLSNPHDASLLGSSIGQQRYAYAITSGIEKYLDSTSQDTQPVPVPSNPNPSAPQQNADPGNILTQLQNLVTSTGTRALDQLSPGVNGMNPLNGTTLDSISQQISRILGTNNAAGGLNNSLNFQSFMNAIRNIPGAQQFIATLQNIPVIGPLFNGLTSNPISPTSLLPTPVSPTPALPLLSPPNA